MISELGESQPRDSCPKPKKYPVFVSDLSRQLEAKQIVKLQLEELLEILQDVLVERNPYLIGIFKSAESLKQDMFTICFKILWNMKWDFLQRRMLSLCTVI